MGKARRTGNAGAVGFDEGHLRRRAHGGHSFHDAERHGNGNGARGVVAHETGKLGGGCPLLHGLDRFGRGVHFPAKGYGVFVVDAADKFYGRASVECGS